MGASNELEVVVAPKGLMQDLQQKIDKMSEHIDVLIKNSQKHDPNELLDKKETAKLLKVSVSSIWLWTKKGKLKSYGIEGRVYYKRAEVLAALNEI